MQEEGDESEVVLPVDEHSKEAQAVAGDDDVSMGTGRDICSLCAVSAEVSERAVELLRLHE